MTDGGGTSGNWNLPNVLTGLRSLIVPFFGIALLHDGVRVTVNSDDPAYFAGYVSDNFSALTAQAGLSVSDVARLARNAFEIAWLTPRARDAYLAELAEKGLSRDR